MSTMRDLHVSHVRNARTAMLRGVANRTDNVDELEDAAAAMPEYSETLLWAADRLRSINAALNDIATRLGSEVVEVEHLSQRVDAVQARQGDADTARETCSA